MTAGCHCAVLQLRPLQPRPTFHATMTLKVQANEIAFAQALIDALQGSTCLSGTCKARWNRPSMHLFLLLPYLHFICGFQLSCALVGCCRPGCLLLLPLPLSSLLFLPVAHRRCLMSHIPLRLPAALLSMGFSMEPGTCTSFHSCSAGQPCLALPWQQGLPWQAVHYRLG